MEPAGRSFDEHNKIYTIGHNDIMTSYTLKKSTKKRRTSTKAPAAKRARSSTPRNALGDSTTVLLSAYVEVDATQAAGATGKGGVVGYSIKCDPVGAKFGVSAGSIPQDGLLQVKARDASNVQIIAPDGQAAGNIAFPRMTTIQALYRQYRVNSVSCKVTTDRHCGLDNPLIALNDKGAQTAVTSVGVAMSQAHRSKVLTEADRTMQYGWKPKTAQEREFHMIADGIQDDNAQFIKILQELEPNASNAEVTCKHRIELSMSITLKDSRMGN